MSDNAPQSFAHHTRWDPLFHFFAAPVFLLTLVWSVAHFIRHPGLHSAGLFVFLTAATIIAAKDRLNPIKVQDRIIRLEERLRLSALLSEPLRSRIPEFTESQLVALRFASDAELPRLAERTLTEKLPAREIKRAIQTWRPDNWRV